MTAETECASPPGTFAGQERVIRMSPSSALPVHTSCDLQFLRAEILI